MSGIVFIADRFHRVPIGRDAELPTIVVACFAQGFARLVSVVQPSLEQFNLRFNAFQFVQKFAFQSGQVHELQDGEFLCLFDCGDFFFHTYSISQNAQKARFIFAIPQSFFVEEKKFLKLARFLNGALHKCLIFNGLRRAAGRAVVSA